MVLLGRAGAPARLVWDFPDHESKTAPSGAVLLLVVFRAFEPAPFGKGIAENELDLRVDAAEVVVGPSLHRVEYVFRDP